MLDEPCPGPRSLEHWSGLSLEARYFYCSFNRLGGSLITVSLLDRRGADMFAAELDGTMIAK